MQACDCYMEIPKECEVEGNSNQYCLETHKKFMGRNKL